MRAGGKPNEGWISYVASESVTKLVSQQNKEFCMSAACISKATPENKTLNKTIQAGMKHLNVSFDKWLKANPENKTLNKTNEAPRRSSDWKIKQQSSNKNTKQNIKHNTSGLL